MTAHTKNVETPLAFAVRTGLAWGRSSSALICWDDVLDMAVSSYWRVRCGLPNRRERRSA